MSLVRGFAAEAPDASPAPANETGATAPVASENEVANKAANEAINKVEEAIEGAAKTINHAAADGAASAGIQFLRGEVFGFTVGQLLLSFGILLIGLIFRNIFALAIIRHLVRWAERSKRLDSKLIEALTRPLSLFLLFLVVYFSLLVLPLDAGVALFIGNLFRGLTMLALFWAALLMTDVFAGFIESRLGAAPDSAIAGFAPLIRKSLKIFVMVVGVLMVVDNLGYNVAGIIATLGLGTAAVALASQDTIKNAFGAMMIALDRPFRVGDWIQVGDKVDGDVESIGLRSTKVRTWPKTVLSIPNGVLANEYINNWSKMPKRRVKQVVGVTYSATAEQMEELVEDIRSLLKADEGVQQDFILVSFTDFGESSLDILVYYFTTSTAWLEHMDVRQRINCKIMRAIKARELSIAFPSRSLYFEGRAGEILADMKLPGDFGAQTPP